MLKKYRLKMQTFSELIKRIFEFTTFKRKFFSYIRWTEQLDQFIIPVFRLCF